MSLNPILRLRRNHLFYIEHEGTHYEIALAEDDLDKLNSSVDPTEIKLNKMNLDVGSKMTMVYDYGCEQTFNIILTEITDMPSGSSTMYPKIIEGAGKGILDNVPADEFGKIVKRIKKTGESTHIYYSPYGTEELWDCRDFDIDLVNKTLKNNIAAIQSWALPHEAVLQALQGRGKGVNTVDTIELVKSFEDYVRLQDNGRAYFLYEYVYKGKIQRP